jgi:hypothetical protein
MKSGVMASSATVQLHWPNNYICTDVQKLGPKLHTLTRFEGPYKLSRQENCILKCTLHNIVYVRRA